MADTVDAHHHLWHYTPAEFGWISDRMQPLQRDFLPRELLEAMASGGVDGSVAVQARQRLDETRFLLQAAEATPQILGVVGWVPLAAQDLSTVLAEFRSHAKLKGVRHVVQEEPDGFLADRDFNRGVEQLGELGLTYDLLVTERQLPQALAFAQRHPRQPMALDHLAKPRIAAHELEPWRAHLRRLADCPNVCCKVSGLVTEADWQHWTDADLLPYLDAALEAFGADRLMAGSDWPVCLVASTYPRWWALLRDWTRDWPGPQRDAFFGGNASRFYRL